MKIDLLNSFETLILVKVKKNSDIFQSDFIYQSGSFNFVDFNNFINFNDLIKNIYRSAPICEGVGYYEYCNQIKEGILYCLNDGVRASFILPLRSNGKDGKTQYFLMNVNRYENDLYILFIYLDDKSGLYNIEDFSTGTFKDALTGLFNYRTLVKHIRENKRRGYLSLFDLNKFKEINDRYGHEVGDEVLKLIANYLISLASMNEVFYRRSGDEFMILVFEQDMDYVLSLINKINDYLATIPSLLKKDFVGAAAFGILELSNELPLLSYEIQSKLVDLAMYQAKKSKKLYHFISHEDALNIIAIGDLDTRINDIAVSLKR